MMVNQRNHEKLELELTIPQVKELQSILPPGYFLTLKSQSSDKESPQATPKRVFLDPEKSAKQESSRESTSGRVLRDRDRTKRKSHLETIYSDYDSTGLLGKLPKGSQDGKKKCLAILQKLKKHKNAQSFLLPPDKSTLSSHNKHIKDHMDLTTVEYNLKAGVYFSTLEFAGDVRKIWTNALICTDEKSPTFLKAKEMSTYFESLFEDVENERISSDFHDLQLRVERLSKELMELNAQKANPQTPARTQVKPQKSVPQTPARSQAKPQKSPAANMKNFEISLQEKRRLGQMIQSLPTQYLRGVCQIVTDGLPNLNDNSEVLEFDIDTLPPVKIRELQKYVAAKLKLKRREQTKSKSDSKKETLANKKQLQNQEISHPKPENETVIEKCEQEEALKVDTQAQGKEEMSDDSDSSFITDSDDSVTDKKKKVNESGVKD